MADEFNDNCWEYVSWKQMLNIDFIREFKDKLHWKSIHDLFRYPIGHEFDDYLIKAGAI